MNRTLKRVLSLVLALILASSLMTGAIPALRLQAEAANNTIENDSLSVQIGDLGQIAVMNIKNTARNINFVLPSSESQQNNTAHQWMGEMIFATRSAATREGLTGAFTEQDVNRTLAAGGSTTATNISATNPYITKTADGTSSVEVDYIGQDLSSTTARTMKGYDVKSVYDMDTADGSLLWSITIKNKSDQYIEFGDVGLPMPWNDKYRSTSDTYSNRLTAHSFAGADSGYGYAIRCSGEGNYMLFTPVVSTGARVEYVDFWVGTGNGTSEYRSGSLYTNWLADQGGWYPGLSVYYIHSKNIRTQTGRGYFTDNSSLILGPGEEKTYSFKFSAIRAGDGTPGTASSDPQNASTSNEEREKNFRSVLYREGMIDAVAVPSFQTVINMDTLIDLHYDSSLIDLKPEDIQILCVHENDPYDAEHIPTQRNGMVNNARTGRGLHDGNPDYTEAVEFVETKVVDGEEHHIYRLKFGCIGNNSLRIDYTLKSTGEAKFTEFEFNVLAELDQIADTHADFMANTTQDNDPNSATYGIYSDWYFASGKDSRQQSHWGDDWSHDNVNFMAMKNYLAPDADQVRSLERYLIDFMWDKYMANTHENFVVANYLSASGIYGTSSNPYTRTFSEVMEATAFFNMYRIVKAYPDLIDYRQPATFYLNIAYGIYHNRAGSGTTGFYGEQQIPAMIEALYEEGMTEEADALKQQFAYTKGRAVANTTYPYGSEFEYDNTGEEGAYSSAKALRKYYPTNGRVTQALNAMAMANRKTRAMRGIQPTWYHYADPVFRGGEGWWNFQYTASLAGYIMDDYLRYQNDEADSPQWAERLSYAAKLSNFNAVNMGQIDDNYVGDVSWRFTMYKGGAGAQNVNDGGTRVMNNGWNDFSGESDEGIYGSLLSISADVTTDPVFGLFGYGAKVTKTDGVYSIQPTDGFGKRINLIDERIYVESIQDAIKQADIDADGSSIKLTLRDVSAADHVSKINLSGAGVQDGFYAIRLNGEQVGQVYISGNEGSANVAIAKDLANAVIEILMLEDGENEPPAAEITVTNSIESPTLAALVPFTLKSIVTDDGAPAGSTITYAWALTSAPEGGELTLTTPDKNNTEARATLPGTYVVTLTVSDGEKSSTATIELTVADAPERTAPVITKLEGTPNYYNPSVADLYVEATPDQYYQGELTYLWELVSVPEGQTAAIADATAQTGHLLVSGPGDYVVKVTVTDADKSTTQTLTVTMGSGADGVQRADAITTRVKVAPELPATLPLILADGSIGELPVTWDPVDPASYAIIGVFEATGTAEGGIKVAIPVYVITGTRVNVAPLATPTAIINSVNDLGGVAGLNDEKVPSSSSDTSGGVWHNWLGDQGGTAWVQYTWDEPMVIDGQEAYYFRDGGGNFQPKNIRVYYRDANNEWREVPNPGEFRNDLNKFNATDWGAIRTTAVRMYMDPVTLGCGVIEWRIFGYTSNLNFKELNAAIAKAEELTELLEDPMKQEVLDEIQAAYELMSDEEATQDQIDAETAKLLALLDRAMASLVGELGEDQAPFVDTANPTNDHIYTDYVASWENLYGIANRDFEPTRSNGGTRLGWGNWSQETGSLHYVGYRWDEAVTLGGFDIYWYDDGGGTRVPSAYSLQYLETADGEWKTATLLTAYGDSNKLNQYNRVYFAPITCVDLRLVMTTASNASGIYRWKVYESLPPEGTVNTKALEAAIAQAQALDLEIYTEETVAALNAALEAAQAVLADEEKTQEQVDAATEALLAAIEGLERAFADKTALEAAIAQAQDIDLEVYTEETVAALNEALEAAQAVMDNENATQEEVDAATEAVLAAIEGLVRAFADTTALEAAIAEAEAKDPALYTEESYAAMGPVLEAAKAVLANREATQEEVDAATETVLAAIAALVRLPMPANIAPQGTASSDYCASWSSVAGVNDQVIPESSNPGYDYNEAYGSWGRNNSALPEPIVITFQEPARIYGAGAYFWYNADGPHNQTGIDIPASYVWEYQTEDGQWVPFPGAVGLGIEEDVMNLTYADPFPATAVRITMYKSVADAYGLGVAELEIYGQFLSAEPVDKTELEAAIGQAEAIENLEDYTEESVAALNEALEAAQAVMDDENATQAEVDAAKDALLAAIAGLTEKPVDKTGLEAAVEEAEALNPVAYTEESMAAVNEALEAAKAVLENEEATQEEVDAAKEALLAAIAALEPFRFEDVQDEGKYFFEPVYWAYLHDPQITKGSSPTLFSPGKNCTRAQVVTFLYRAAGEPEVENVENPFTDLKETGYYYKAVLWAVENEITAGTSATTFSPNANCTRAQIVTFLWRYAGKPPVEGMENPFTDVPAGKSYSDAVLWAYANEITKGKTATTFVPGGTCSRGEVVTFLYRMMNPQ